MENIWQYADVFILILVRATSLFIISPVFGRKNMPAMLKIGFGVIIAFIILPTIDITSIQKYDSVLQYSLVVVNEFLIGLVLGFISYMSFTALYIAGEIIDTQIGFGMVNVIDPQSNIQMPVMANFLNIFAMLIFLLLDGHHVIISAIFYSYKVLPIGVMSVNSLVVNDFVKIFADMFIIGFKIAAPVTAAILIADLVLGILARTVPQMHVFEVGMPLKIVIGLGAVMVMIPIFITILDVIINGMYQDLETIMKDMVPK